MQNEKFQIETVVLPDSLRIKSREARVSRGRNPGSDGRADKSTAEQDKARPTSRRRPHTK